MVGTCRPESDIASAVHKRYWYASLLLVLILAAVFILQRDEQHAIPDEAPGATPADAPGLASQNARGAVGVAPGDSPNSSTNVVDDAHVVARENLDNQSSIDALSADEFPELGLPPDIGMHEQLAAFASEGRDPEWSTQAEGRILDRISQAGIDANTMQVECRESLCRVYISHPADTEVSFTTIDQLSLGSLGSADRIPAFFGFVNRLPVRIIYLRRDVETVP